MSISDRDQTQFAHGFAAMLNARNPDMLDELLAENYINHNVFVPDGLAANKAFWRQWIAAFPDTRVVVEDAFAAGDRIVGRYTYRATHLGEFMGIPPTGRTIEMRSIDIWRVVDGRLAEHWDEINTLEFMQQLGAIPAIAPVADSRA
jgi:steroid delta-isomerase-like uncharacterized protein